MSEPREWTEDEVREKFVQHIWYLVGYCESKGHLSERAKLERLAGSILREIDGDGYRRFILATVPHPKDKFHKIDHGENYYAENHEAKVKCDIAGSLHELFHQVRPAKEDV